MLPYSICTFVPPNSPSTCPGTGIAPEAYHRFRDIGYRAPKHPPYCPWLERRHVILKVD